MNTATVYRVGPLRSGPHSADLEAFWAHLDSYKPDFHPIGRLDAIYAAPTIMGLHRWLDNLVYNLAETAPVYALTVDADSLYAYDISSYEEIERPHFRKKTTPSERSIIEYWDSGMPLSEWNSTWSWISENAGYNTEVLVPQDAILDSIPLHVPELASLLSKVADDMAIDSLLSRTWAITCSCCSRAA